MRLVATAVLFAFWLPAGVVYAVGVGDVLPRVTVEAATGESRVLPDEHAHVLVIEDGESQEHKQPAHAIVGRYTDDTAKREWLVAIADVEKWRWWPARGYVLRATARSSAREHTPIWLDWHGALRSVLGLRTSESTFVVVGADDRIRFFAQGRLSDAQQHALDAALTALTTP